MRVCCAHASFQWGSIEVNKEEMSYPISLVCPGTLLHEHMHPLGGENGGPFWIGAFIRNRLRVTLCP